VTRYDSASGGNGTAACAAKSIAGLGCTDQGVPTGTWYYTVTPVLGHWQGAESARSAGAAVDTTPPAAPTVTAPAYVNSTTAVSVPVSGTTEPGASIALAVTDAATPANTVNATAIANGSGTWNAVVNVSSLNDGTLTYKAVATDTAGNPGNPATPGTASSVKDVVAPAVSAVALADGGATGSNAGKMEPKDKATITFSKALDASTICSNWAAGASGTLNGSNQVTVTISSRNVLTVSVDSAACATSRIGTVGLGSGTTYGPATGTVTYKGTGSNASIVSWDSTTKKLTITLGALSSGNPSNGTEQPAAPSYSPPVGIKDIAGNGLPTDKFTSLTASRF
jgi:hypothetical protein